MCQTESALQEGLQERTGDWLAVLPEHGLVGPSASRVARTKRYLGAVTSTPLGLTMYPYPEPERLLEEI